MKVQENNESHCDVAIIGAGVCGASIARTLSRYRLKVSLLEREVDVSFGTSKANSGIIHGGFHHNSEYLKTKLEVEGASLYDRLQRELGFPFKRCGILVAAMHPDELLALEHLYTQGKENGAPGIELCSRQRMLDLEPKLSTEVVGGLYAPSGGIVEPYRFVFALVENAKNNGLDLQTEFNVIKADKIEDGWALTAKDGRKISARYVINAAGLHADTVSSLFGAEEFTIKPRKGEYFLLDRLAAGCPSRVIFPVPSKVSKGMLVIPTVEGTTLIGPTADEIDDKGDLATTAERLALITVSARNLIPSISERDVITSFAGLRPVLEEDFYIALSKKVPRLVQVAGIQSPGLTAAPAIAEYVKNILLKDGLELSENPSWEPNLRSPLRVREMSVADRARLIAEKPAYGNIICRCEEVSEAEIVEAIRHGHTTLDGVKFYTRAQMGRCQGGFCTYKIIKLIMRETGMSYDKVTKRGYGSQVLEGEL
ncbi:MAG TPA: NAD(P)/FAD-dependent oxidoreductase [Treponemataceae bacterium]|nr:NAD(P)/FAD-dependent oxidoreductase [Treponemataceae bacterium]